MSVTDEELLMLGASDASALFLNEGLIALYWRVTTGERTPSTSEMKDGTLAERFTRARYLERTGYEATVEQKWRHPFVLWMRASPDATVTTPEGRGGAEWKFWRSFPEEVGGVPERAWLQCQVLMGVGIEVLGEWDQPWMDLVNGYGALDVRRVPYKEGVLERFITLGDRFMTDFVARREVPQGPNLVLLERDAVAIKALYPRETRPERRAWESLGEDQQRKVTAWLEANAARREWAAREEALFPAVVLAIGEAAGIDHDGGRIDCKEQAGPRKFEKARFDAALDAEGEWFAERVRALVREYTKDTTTRPLVAR